MGAEFTDLTWEDLCDLMCGQPEEDFIEEDDEINDIKQKKYFLISKNKNNKDFIEGN